jgi:uncharacterized iron-regulated protein
MRPYLPLLLRGAALALALSALTACSMSQLPIGNPEAPYPPAQPPRVGEILHIPTGTGVSAAQMQAAASDARIVYVGETHDNPAAHRVQLAVLQAMAERWPGQVSLGMEMLTRAQQPVLDRWVAGELSEKAFLKEADWYTVWSLDFALYSDLLHFAREQKIPVVGLNAEKALVRAVSQNEPAELSDEERSQLPEMDMSDPYQTAMVEAVFGGHTAGAKHLAGFQRVQTLWDETMAESVVRHLQSFPHDNQRMVVLAGSHHIRYGFGIPRRVFRRLPVSYALIGSEEVEFPEHRLGQRMRVQMPAFPMPPYDYVVFTAYEDLPGDRVKLGVRMEEQDGRVVVLAVVPGSAAERGGVLAGDTILSLDGEPITENFDLVYAVGQHQAGDRSTLTVERAGETLQLEVEFQPLPQPAGHTP